ncbi:acyltransferase domain-containing protein [Kribbella sp. NBC_00709]|uniref:acyltransferase domain-containing protein n=1 Tax=Kribbella sp. NBC_00709 TaxID=2975972 RepID=UPI002E2DA7BC|nr:acyltransferase domain-containing protein [Kribbella sp. NBC_00709]
MGGDAAGGWRGLGAVEVGRRLGLAGGVVERLAAVSGMGGPDVVLPTDEAVGRLCVKLAIERVDRESLLAARPDAELHPELWWVLSCSYRLLLAQMGQRRFGDPAWQPLPDGTGTVGRHLFVWAFLAVVPHVRDYHATIGLTDDESWESLGALGDELASSRRLTGRAGLDASWGLPLVFTGAGFRLGRLAFERQPRQVDGATNDFLGTGESALNTHVPGSREPLSEAACDTSFARAVELMDQLPEYVVGFACHSWLMDTQLTQYLPASSNIVRFQRRFTQFTDQVEADWAPLEHVFHRRYDGPAVPKSLLDDLPQRTTLERAIVTHLRRGGHWYNQTGWIRTSEAR